MAARLMLGINPLIGVDHLSNDRARLRGAGPDLTRALEVIQAAVDAGADGFTFSPSRKVISILRAAQATGAIQKLKLYPLLPALDKYWPAFLNRGTYGLVGAILEDLSPVAKARALLKGGVAALMSDPFAALGLYIDVELSKIRAAVPQGWAIDTVFLGETFTDMSVSLGAYNLIQSYCRFVESHKGISAGLQTLNIPMLLEAQPKLGTRKSLLIMAPFNPRGFQMTPDRETWERAAAGAPSPRIVAISVLAAGQVAVDEAVRYLSQRRSLFASVVVGTSNPRHATEAFRAFGRLFD